jgi:uncharacterized membrane-anchored protein
MWNHAPAGMLRQRSHRTPIDVAERPKRRHVEHDHHRESPMKMLAKWIIAIALCATHAVGLAARTDEEIRDGIAALGWKHGPTSTPVGAAANLVVPKDTAFLADTEGSKFLELTGNLPQPGNAILMGGTWWATLTFQDVGYVKDDETIDADALLKDLKEQDAPANEERRKLGLPELHTDGWYVPPHYDPQTKHLEWGLRLKTPGEAEPTINYTVRLLGRKGYEAVTLVSSPERLDADVKELKTILASFTFNAGESYDEFKPGDHVAEFGLAALVAGGAAAAAAKSGLWKVILGFLAASWKLVAAGAVAVVAGAAKLLGRKKDS